MGVSFHLQILDGCVVLNIFDAGHLNVTAALALTRPFGASPPGTVLTGARVQRVTYA